MLIYFTPDMKQERFAPTPVPMATSPMNDLPVMTNAIPIATTTLTAAAATPTRTRSRPRPLSDPSEDDGLDPVFPVSPLSSEGDGPYGNKRRSGRQPSPLSFEGGEAAVARTTSARVALARTQSINGERIACLGVQDFGQSGDVQDLYARLVMASGRPDKGLQHVDITWAAGKEPDALARVKESWQSSPKFSSDKGPSPAFTSFVRSLISNIPRPATDECTYLSRTPTSPHPLRRRSLCLLASTLSPRYSCGCVKPNGPNSSKKFSNARPTNHDA